MQLIHFRNKITDWYLINQRTLPWREFPSPYRVWVSEIILQQTRVDQGIRYFNNFIERFPDLESLANASEDEVLKLWQGLGYYTRARNMLRAARLVMDRFNGQFPGSSSELEKLPGIGPYTAAAIASIAFNEPVAAVDGNAFRVFSRYFNIELSIDSPEGKKHFIRLANETIDPNKPGAFNQGIMDLGATICMPKKPKCNNCPIQEHCVAPIKNLIDQRPVRTKNQNIASRYFYYLYIEANQSFFLQKRTGKDIWKSLYEFPLIESEKALEPEQLFLRQEWKNIFGNTNPTIVQVSKPMVHRLSHQALEIVFLRIEAPVQKIFPENFLKVCKNDIFGYAVPRPIERYLMKL